MAIVQDNQISITLSGQYYSDPSPNPCANALLGPLAPGEYQVSVFVIDTGATVPTPGLVATTTLTVTPDKSQVPGLSLGGIVLLGFLMAAAGVLGLKRQRQSPHSPPS